MEQRTMNINKIMILLFILSLVTIPGVWGLSISQTVQNTLMTQNARNGYSITNGSTAQRWSQSIQIDSSSAFMATLTNITVAGRRLAGATDYCRIFLYNASSNGD